MYNEHKIQNISVLSVDDDPIELKFIEVQLRKFSQNIHFDVESLGSLSKLEERLTGNSVDVVILDVHFQNSSQTGIDFIERVKKQWPGSVLLIRTSDTSLILEAISKGADDFIGKDITENEIGLRIIKTMSMRTPVEQNIEKTSSGYVGSTMQHVAKRLQRILSSSVQNIMVRGESGTGKEVVVDVLESVAGSQVVRVNCAAIAPELFDSEFFGHVKGAYTGAAKDTQGLAELANDGWLFLDEVATIPINCQAKLLRLIDNHELKRVGDQKTRHVHVKIISATNENLELLIEQGKFRQDLFQRLVETEILLPPLRERVGETAELIDYFCNSLPNGPYKMTKPTQAALENYHWSDGNIRELRNCIRAMTENHVDKLLAPMSIPTNMLIKMTDVLDCEDAESHESAKSFSTNSLTLNWEGSPTPSFQELSDKLFVELLQLVVHEKGKLSLRSLERLLGIPRSRISDKLKHLIAENVISAKDVGKWTNIQL